MRLPPYTPTPGSDAELESFRLLQERLADHHKRFSADPSAQYTAVIIPSQSVDPVELAKIEGVAHYEERSLFNLMLLRHPRLRIVYVTSKRLNPLVVDYYLHHMRGVPGAHARRRMTLLDCDDASPRPLTQKILERPRLMQRIAETIIDRDMAHITVFNSTPLERTLSVQLGIPLYGCDPLLTHHGSKTGARRIFRDAGVKLAPGREGLRDEQDLVEGLDSLWSQVPDARRMVVKLNESFSGEGNALVDLEPLADVAPGSTGSPDRQRRLREALPTMRFVAQEQGWETYSEQFSQMGGVCEQWIEGEGKRSPSVQLRISPVREPQPVSTHDQVLGGPSGQIFLGGTFPADAGYRMAIQQLGLRVGQVLADKGVIGRFGVDFLAVPTGNGPGGHETDTPGVELYAVEINLRSGGTTHPFNTLKFLTDGRYDEETGTYYTAQGQARCYFATDAIKSARYRGIMPFDLLNELIMRGMHFQADATGVVFHLFGCLSEFGKLGCTAIAPTVPEARSLYEDTVNLLNEAARRRFGEET